MTPTTHKNFSIPFAILVALSFITGSLQVYASHPAGGTCKHKGGLYSLCAAGQGGKKCTRGTQKGKCSQQAKGCTCDTDRAPILDAAITDFREAFDVILASPGLPLACDQVGAVADHLANGLAVLSPLVAEPDFVTTGFLATLDSLLADLSAVQLIATACAVVLPAGIEPTLLTLKTNYLATFADLVE